MPRYWTINGRFLTQKLTGVQRYGREIVRALDDLVRDGHPLTRDLRLELLVPGITAALPELSSIPIRRTGGLKGHLWEQIALPLYAKGGVLSLCNTSTVFRSKQIVCIHDLNIVEFPASYSRQFRMLYRVLLPLVAHRAVAVTTVSRFSRAQLMRHHVAQGYKVAVVPNGHEHVWEWAPQTSQACAAVDSSTVMVIGSPAPHKNVGLLLALADDLATHGIRLAVAGSLDAKVFAHEIGRGSENVAWLGYLSDDELADALSRCLCLAFPSFVEGFGLPPLEAMARGCPVVVSDRTSLPEVCGNAALYASPEHAQEWLRAFLSLRRDLELRADLIRRGLLQASSFSWRRSAELYLEAMARADEVFETNGASSASLLDDWQIRSVT
ncbi:glycosyltransferase family 4 protein [Microvirga massiliensis]|uniref:glycosyltransferase family 4 protein n=1 Tax=Microvirga massiliensis TaxID=1033741 RepID=UPI00062B351D|nr:glycosyltransferase family 1 protein [Microvirga massiliensis]